LTLVVAAASARAPSTTIAFVAVVAAAATPQSSATIAIAQWREIIHFFTSFPNNHSFRSAGESAGRCEDATFAVWPY